MLKILNLRIFVVLFKVNKSQWQCSHTDGCHHRGGRRWFRFVHIISERLVVGVIPVAWSHYVGTFFILMCYSQVLYGILILNLPTNIYKSSNNKRYQQKTTNLPTIKLNQQKSTNLPTIIYKSSNNKTVPTEIYKSPNKYLQIFQQ